MSTHHPSSASPQDAPRSSSGAVKTEFIYKRITHHFEGLGEEQLEEIESFVEGWATEPLLQAAANPETEGAYLAQLARIPDSAVQERIAANPATPQEVLLDLGECYPEAFMQNPTILFEEFFGNSLDWGRFMRIQKFLAYKRKLLSGDPLEEEHLDTAMDLACHFADTVWAQSLIRDKRAEVRRLLARNVGGLQTETVAPILLESEDFEVRANLAENAQIDHPTLLELAEDPEPVIRRLVADSRSPQAGPAHWRLFRKGEKDVLIRLAENEAIDPELATALADHSPEVRLKLAARERLSEPAIERLLAWNEEPVNLLLAMNQHLISSAGPHLLKNGSPAVQREMALNPECPSPILGLLAHRQDPVLHDLLLQRKNLSTLMTLRILQDAPPTMSRKVAERMAVLDASRDDPATRQTGVQSPPSRRSGPADGAGGG